MASRGNLPASTLGKIGGLFPALVRGFSIGGHILTKALVFFRPLGVLKV
jgi:hypothetical protein